MPRVFHGWVSWVSRGCRNHLSTDRRCQGHHRGGPGASMELYSCDDVEGALRLHPLKVREPEAGPACSQQSAKNQDLVLRAFAGQDAALKLYQRKKRQGHGFLPIPRNLRIQEGASS